MYLLSHRFLSIFFLKGWNIYGYLVLALVFKNKVCGIIICDTFVSLARNN